MIDLGIFAAITLGSMALFRALSDLWQPGRGRIRRRLAGEFGNDDPANAPTPLYKNVAQWNTDLGSRADLDLESNDAAPPPPTLTWRERTETLLEQSGVPLGVQLLVRLVAGLMVLLGFLGLVFGGWLACAVGVAVGLLGPLGVLFAKRKARRERYRNQLAGAFELMARVLRAGQSVPEAFRAAVGAFDDPLTAEFTRCVHQIEHGIRPEVAYRDLSQRSRVVELRIFVVAMTIQRQSGGNLSEVLERLAAVVRGRQKQRQKIRGLTAEGRLQSLTLMVLPVVTFAAMYVLNRQYAEVLLEQWRLLAATAALMGVGAAWIRSIMNFEG